MFILVPTLLGARAFAHNFDLAELEKAISYAKIRGVKTNLTLNTLIKDTEFVQAISLAKYAYRFGIDAIIDARFRSSNGIDEAFPFSSYSCQHTDDSV